MNAGMAELADALDLESSVSRREGSSPFTRTKILDRHIRRKSIGQL